MGISKIMTGESILWCNCYPVMLEENFWIPNFQVALEKAAENCRFWQRRPNEMRQFVLVALEESQQSK